MYLSKLIPNPEASGPLWLSQAPAGDTYRLHQRLYAYFPGTPEGQRPFLYRESQHRRQGADIYLLSETSPQTPSEKVLPWKVLTKPFRPQLSQGEHLAFSLRANPVVCQKRRRHDVVMARIHPLKQAGKPFDRQGIIREAGLAWLKRQSDAKGFRFDDDNIRISGYRQHRFYKRLGKSGEKQRSIQFTTLDFDGFLQVHDPTLFQKALREGIGRAKGFGCGLLLIKRA